jgi:hypothetical protein
VPGTKGQVTVFIILGLLLVAIFGLFLFFTSSTVEESVTSASRPVTETVPSEFIAIQEYTETCLRSTAKEALIILGQQGGYLYPDNVGEYSGSDPTNSDGINLDSLSIPFWHYNSQPNGDAAVSISSLQPSLDDEEDYFSITNQVGRYIDENIEDCLQGYASFKDAGFTINYETKDTTVRIFDGELDFILDMPLTASRSDATTEISIFYNDIDLELKKYYQIANDITAAENNYTFLENHIINLLSVFSRTGDSEFPPIMAMTIERYSSDLWITAEVKQSLIQLLTSYVPLIRHYGDDNFYRTEFVDSDISDLYQRVYDDMILMVGSDDGGLDVNFNYYGWNPFLSINGGEDEIRPSRTTFKSIVDIVPFEFTTQDYINTYDISYPVLVTVVDDDAFDDEGYVFNFALESNVINNEPYEADYTQAKTLVGNQGLLACDEEQWSTGFLRSLVVDSFSHEPIDLVEFSFSIPGFESCLIGESSSNGVVNSKYPSVIGGELELYKDGYLGTTLVLDTSFFNGEEGIIGYAIEGSNDAVLELYEQKTINVALKQKPISKCIQYIDMPDCTSKLENNYLECVEEYLGRACFFNSGDGLFLNSNDLIYSSYSNGSSSVLNEYYLLDSMSDNSNGGTVETIFVFDRISDVGGSIPGIFEDEFFSSVSFSSIDQIQEIDLYPGEYSVTAYATIKFDKPYLIPQDERCMTQKEKSCSDFSKQEFDEILLAQISWDTEATYFTITTEDLYSSDQLDLILPTVDWAGIPKTFTIESASGDDFEINGRLIEDTQILSMLSNISKLTAVRAALEPQWSSS